MKQNKRSIACSALIAIGILSLLCGVLYPLAMTGISQVIFPDQANGSQIIIEKGGREIVVGSEFLAQKFTGPEYLIGRSDIGIPSNQSAVSEEQEKLIQERIAWWHDFDPSTKGKDIPDGLVTGSGSGVDPEISPIAAKFQVERIARERGLTQEAVQNIINEETKGKTFAILGEERVNVLMVNLRLDGYKIK